MYRAGSQIGKLSHEPLDNSWSVRAHVPGVIDARESFAREKALKTADFR